jgi:hypothetical protein
MNTFKIFFNYFGNWQCYKDNQGFDIELLALNAAQTVAKDLAGAGMPLYPPQSSEWYICDSHGKHYPLV